MDVQQAELDRAIAALLTVGTYLGVGLLAVGVVLMAVAGVSPMGGDPLPVLDVSRLPSDLAAGRPEGFLWLGLITVIATPASRVAASLIGYARSGERRMVLVSFAILAVIAASVAIGLSSLAEPGR